jgi:ferric-dicitrate binding protein FerR (iron transport regulator)
LELEEQEIDQHILNYLRGEATANEIEELRNWIKKDQANENSFEALRSYWQSSSLQIEYPNLDMAYAKLKSFSDISSEPGIRHINKSRGNNFAWLRYAAAILMLISISGIIYFSINNQNNTSPIKIANNIVKENPKGQKLTTFLPDGSKVILNSQSRIEYKQGFASDERLIMLDGEAFFEVSKDETKAFRVLANGVSTIALGTSFNVKAKPNKVEIALVSGSVQVFKDEDNVVILEPGKSASVAVNGEIKVQKFNIDEKVGWKDGLLVFKDNTIPEIIERLNDWYGVKIILETPLKKNQHFSGKYRNAPLEEVLEGISFVHQFDYEITGDTVRIYKKHIN